MKGKIPVLLLFGPTGSGKTEFLEQLFTGSDPVCPAEVISADSMQVYRGMDIGTAKPSPELLSALSHHLINIRSPQEQFNAGEFVRLADEKAADIFRRGKLPVVSGGTGFYLSNFMLGLPPAPPSDPAIRQALQEELRIRGAAALAGELAACDPLSAGRIHLNDEYRLLRALEVYRLSGRPLSSFPLQGIHGVTGSAPGRPLYRFLLIGLKRPREEVYRRIDLRCQQMFREGLPGEVQRLWEEGLRPGDPGIKAIGYREFFLEDREGRWRQREDLAGVEAIVARNSRRYAKRQITYFAMLPGVRWISAGSTPGEDDGAERIRRELTVFLSSEPPDSLFSRNCR
ncbi:MAG: tRNA (adenosine(37)-N6)-dimethylallyltransferase MiaA [Treponema sp.]|jgi:tRNA dimethylallyltransferase|nr:tRNA (adenosine(37)-N6)-dimethylallyltransferase MiaA [Treponema sp.]